MSAMPPDLPLLAWARQRERMDALIRELRAVQQTYVTCSRAECSQTDALGLINNILDRYDRSSDE